MKVKLCYEAVRYIEVEVDEKYRECIKANQYWNEALEHAWTDLIEHCEDYAKKRDPDFLESSALLDEHNNVVGEW